MTSHDDVREIDVRAYIASRLDQTRGDLWQAILDRMDAYETRISELEKEVGRLGETIDWVCVIRDLRRKTYRLAEVLPPEVQS